MSKNYALTAKKRDRAGKGVARALRRENQIPAVIYGDKKEPILLSLGEKEITLQYNKGTMYTHLCDLSIDGEKQLCIARDVQTHPVTDKIEHADFLRVSPKTKIVVQVPLDFINQEGSPGMKAGGVLNVVSHELDLLCPATDIPEYIEVDLTGTEIGDSLRMDKVPLPKGVEAVDYEPDHVIATIIQPKSSKADDEAEAAAAAAASAASAAEAGTAAASPGAAAPAADAKKEEKK